MFTLLICLIEWFLVPAKVVPMEKKEKATNVPFVEPEVKMIYIVHSPRIKQRKEAINERELATWRENCRMYNAWRNAVSLT